MHCSATPFIVFKTRGLVRGATAFSLSNFPLAWPHHASRYPPYSAGTDQTPTSLRQWLAVIAVAISAFAFVTSEFLPVGLLPAIAHDLGVSSGVAGLMVTTPGVVAAIFAPTLIIGAGRLDRRYAFLMLTAALLVANLVCALAGNLGVMLVGRALLGAALGASGRSRPRPRRASCSPGTRPRPPPSS